MTRDIVNRVGILSHLALPTVHPDPQSCLHAHFATRQLPCLSILDAHVRAWGEHESFTSVETDDVLHQLLLLLLSRKQGARTPDMVLDRVKPRGRAEAVDDTDRAQIEQLLAQRRLLSGDDDSCRVVSLFADGSEETLGEVPCGDGGI